MNNKRYQLINPTINNKIYKTDSLRKASKKSFEEINNLKIPGLQTFTIKNIDTGETFTFKIHKPYQNENKINPTIDEIPNANTLDMQFDKFITNTKNNIKQSSNLLNLDDLINLNTCPPLQEKILEKNQEQSIDVNKKIETIVSEIKYIELRMSQLEKKIESKTTNNGCIIS